MISSKTKKNSNRKKNINCSIMASQIGKYLDFGSKLEILPRDY